MGMFDNVRCEVPLPDGWDGQGMQTKDFGCTMATLTIKADGRLVTDDQDWWLKEKQPERDLQFHGVFNFYGHEGKWPNIVWHEYDAKFTDGKLVSISPTPEAERDR